MPDPVARPEIKNERRIKMKISELVKILNQTKKQVGDIKVFFSCDEENDFQ